MSGFETIVGVLSEHPDYSTRLDDGGWLALCTGAGCSWSSGPLPRVTAPDGAGAAARAHRDHVAGALLAALPGPPITIQMGGPPVVHMGSVPARCVLCGDVAHPFGGCPAGPSAAVLRMVRQAAR